MTLDEKEVTKKKACVEWEKDTATEMTEEEA